MSKSSRKLLQWFSYCYSHNEVFPSKARIRMKFLFHGRLASFFGGGDGGLFFNQRHHMQMFAALLWTEKL